MKFNPSKNADNKLVPGEFNNFKRGTGSGDLMQLFQDPTVLGFKLFFMNIADTSTVDENNVISNVIDTTNVINSTGLFGNEKNPNSALYYLNSIGDTARFKMLLDFKSLLSSLNTDYPWYFQSIEGLSEAWSRDYNIPKFKKELTINCLESVDLRITALMDLYRKIAYDWQYRRAILPDNLRKFDLSIKVFDVRNLQKDPGLYLENKSDINDDKKQINSEFLGSDYTDTTQITFNLSQCEFEPNDSGNMFGNISNVDYEHSSQVIKINYENIQEDNIYRTLVALGNNKSHYYVRDYLRKELIYLTSSNASTLNAYNESVLPGEQSPNNPNFKERIQQSTNDKIDEVKSIDLKEQLGGVFDDINENVSSQAANLVKSKISSLYLGNVYGFSSSSLVGTARNNVTSAPGISVGNTFD